ncbi:MAG: glycine-rich protein [Labilithrix sp.]
MAGAHQTLAMVALMTVACARDYGSDPDPEPPKAQPVEAGSCASDASLPSACTTTSPSDASTTTQPEVKPLPSRTFDAAGEFPLDFGRCSEISIRLWGAGGGEGLGALRAGAGGFASAVLSVDPGAALEVVVGGPGRSATAAPGSGGAPGGGGMGGAATSSQPGGGGGGYSGVFRGTISAANALLIAGGGGGGGGGSGHAAGAGGGADGGGDPGLGGTQTTGFAPLQGGAGGKNNDGGGGGGGGWFGGVGGAAANSDGVGGGGGSGFVEKGAKDSVLAAGVGRTPGNAADSARGTAGNPGAPGKVIARCIALAP